MTPDEQEAEREHREDLYRAPPALRHLYARPAGMDDEAWRMVLQGRERMQIKAYGIRITRDTDWRVLDAYYAAYPTEQTIVEQLIGRVVDPTHVPVLPKEKKRAKQDGKAVWPCPLEDEDQEEE